MSDWEKIELSKLINLVIDYRGKTPKKIGFSEFFESGYPVLSAKHIKNRRLVNLDNLRFGNDDMYKKWMKDEIQKGDVILTSEAPLGEVYYVDNNNKYILGQRVFGLRVNREKLVPKYLEIWLSSKNGQNELFKRASGSTVQGIKQRELLQIIVDVPPIKIQEKISEVELSLSNKIALNTQTNQTLEAIAQAIFKHWFIDFAPVRAKAQALAEGKTAADAELAAMQELSGKTAEEITALQHSDPEGYLKLQQTAAAFPSEFITTEDGEIPLGWEILNLGGMATFIKGKKAKKTFPKKEKGYLPIILNNSLSGNYSEFCSPEKLVIVNKYETLILMDGSSSGKIEIGHHGIVGSTFAKLALIKDDYWAILYHFLKTKEKDIKENTTGTSIPHTDKNRVLSYKIVVPTNNILNMFNQIFQKQLDAMLFNKKENEILSQTRDTLLPKLLNGEIKL